MKRVHQQIRVYEVPQGRVFYLIENLDGERRTTFWRRESDQHLAPLGIDPAKWSATTLLGLYQVKPGRVHRVRPAHTIINGTSRLAPVYIL